MTKELLQQALDALESCKVFDGKSEWDYFDLDKVAAAITAIKKALAQQEQQQAVPIGYWCGKFVEGASMLYEVEQESLFGRKYSNLPVYTHPAPTQPALSDDEIRKYFDSENGLENCCMCHLDDFVKVYRAIEAHCRGGK